MAVLAAPPPPPPLRGIWGQRKWHPDGSAQQGCNTTIAAAKRQAIFEAQRHTGAKGFTFLWDLTKLYDSGAPDVVHAALAASGFPLVLETLSALIHRASRRLRASGIFGPTLESTGRSLLAGCLTSTSQTRALLLPPHLRRANQLALFPPRRRRVPTCAGRATRLDTRP